MSPQTSRTTRRGARASPPGAPARRRASAPPCRRAGAPCPRRRERGRAAARRGGRRRLSPLPPRSAAGARTSPRGRAADPRRPPPRRGRPRRPARRTEDRSRCRSRAAPRARGRDTTRASRRSSAAGGGGGTGRVLGLGEPQRHQLLGHRPGGGAVDVARGLSRAEARRTLDGAAQEEPEGVVIQPAGQALLVRLVEVGREREVGRPGFRVEPPAEEHGEDLALRRAGEGEHRQGRGRRTERRPTLLLTGRETTCAPGDGSGPGHERHRARVRPGPSSRRAEFRGRTSACFGSAVECSSFTFRHTEVLELGPSPGGRLGPYEIVAPIGAGGMGEVYRATDTRLGRDVALKLLPEAFASDPERLARFEREAKLLASLNHPGIAHLYGFESATVEGGAKAHVLAMEFVAGEDLAERLKRGPIPVDEAIAIARQVAEALEEAHEKGIVHRDLKPANLKAAADGKVKVLDFGLAKAWTGEGAAATSSADFSQSPTLASTGSAAGLILGTAAYMSPEQARGKAVDRRADIWAFGVVLFEMLAGRKLFEGETVTDVLASVVRDPIDWSSLPANTPLAVRALLERCLERDSRQRLRDIGEARIALERGPGRGAFRRRPERSDGATADPRRPPVAPGGGVGGDRRVASRRRAPGARGRPDDPLRVRGPGRAVADGPALARRALRGVQPGSHERGHVAERRLRPAARELRGDRPPADGAGLGVLLVARRPAAGRRDPSAAGRLRRRRRVVAPDRRPHRRSRARRELEPRRRDPALGRGHAPARQRRGRSARDRARARERPLLLARGADLPPGRPPVPVHLGDPRGGRERPRDPRR